MKKPVRPELTPSTPVDQIPHLLTARQVAMILGLRYGTVYEMVKRKELPCRRFGKLIFIPKDALLPQEAP